MISEKVFLETTDGLQYAAGIFYMFLPFCHKYLFKILYSRVKM